MLRFGRLCRRLAAVGVLALGGAGGLGSGYAGAADQCLPPPQVLLSEVARVAGTGSQLWADIQAAEDADAAAGTSAPGQVVQDLLSAAAKDGYQWDCAGSQLVAPANAPPRIDAPPETTTVAPLAGSGATVSGGTSTVPATGGPTVAGAAVTGHASTVPATGGSTVPPDTSAGVSVLPDTSAGSSVLAAPAASSSGGGGGGGSTILLLVLAAGSGVLVIVVVRRQLARR